MPVFQLTDDLIFPHPSLADSDGWVAFGGDLSIDRLLLAYHNGIFPWPVEGFPLLWNSPDPRLVIFPENFRITKSFRQTLRSKKFEVRLDTCFSQVVEYCSKVPRQGQAGTWILPDMKEAFAEFHEAGYAHSVETFHKGKLVGGLYGVAIGGVFSGESMFHLMSDASKVALHFLNEKIKQWGLDFIDAQTSTPHLRRMGGKEISREEYLDLLHQSLRNKPTQKGKWANKE